jgi:hypothetical protein
MPVNLFPSKILEAQLEDALRFLGSDEHQPAQKLQEKLGRITRMLGTITAAVDAQCDQRLRISTPPGNPQPGPSSTYSNHQQLSTPDVFSSTLMGTVHPALLNSSLRIKQNRFQGVLLVSDHWNQKVHGRGSCQGRLRVSDPKRNEKDDGRA